MKQKECIFETRKNQPCRNKKCRLYIDYKDDLNCTLVATNKKPEMTFAEIAKRLGISLVRVKQIQDRALEKLQKK